MVVIRRCWARQFFLPIAAKASLSYGSGFSSVTLTVKLQSLIYEILTPISLRIAILNSKGGKILFSSYNSYSCRFLGTWVSTLRNIIWGSLFPFYILLEVRGLGYKVSVRGASLEFSLGFSHLVYFKLPPTISARQVGAKFRAINIISPN